MQLQLLVDHDVQLVEKFVVKSVREANHARIHVKSNSSDFEKHLSIPMIWQLPNKEVKQFDNFVLATTSNRDEQSIAFDQLFDQTEDYFWVATFERCIQGLSILEALQVLLIRL